MKLQLDTKAKVIRLEEKVVLKDLIDTLDRLLPKQWEDFTLEVNTTIEWSHPIVIKREYPWWQSPWYVGTHTWSNTLGDTGSNYELKAGTYNVEA